MVNQAQFTAQLSGAVSSVGDVIGGVRDEQWTAPTPCTDWSVRDVVGHLVGMNLVFTALLTDNVAPERDIDRLGEDPVGAYRASASDLMSAFSQPGVLERTFIGPLGAATGEDRLQIRLYDLLAHGWDLARATGQALDVPEDVAERSLAFALVQLVGQSRDGRFGRAQSSSEDAPAIDRLAAFLGRSMDTPEG
jgi:uncharacterized protein (TIGR03086 family)